MLNTYSQLLAGSFLILGFKIVSSGGNVLTLYPKIFKSILSAIEPFKKNSVYAIQLETTDLSFKVNRNVDINYQNACKILNDHIGI